MGPKIGRWPRLSTLAPWLLVVMAVLNGFALGRYPHPYVDEAFFGFPAARAAIGGPFAYQAAVSAPYGNELWAYHGPPLFSRLLELLYKIFGFSVALSRLPDFLGAWLAAALIVLWLNRRGYRYAGFIFTVLWCGSRAVQEVMYCRMEGLALMFVVLAYLCLNRIREYGDLNSRWGFDLEPNRAALGCGCLCGMAALTHPLCILFAIPAYLWTFYFDRKKAAIRFMVGGLATVPLLFALLVFQIRVPVAQFLWLAHVTTDEPWTTQIGTLVSTLQWSRYWFLALSAFTLTAAPTFAICIYRKGRAPWIIDGALALSFGLIGLKVVFGSQTRPYYLVYFSIWAILALAILIEKHWSRMVFSAPALLTLWLMSASWNVMRMREPFHYHAALNSGFAINQLHTNVPESAQLVATPDIYALPLEAGYKHYALTWWFPGHQDVCPSCYLLTTEDAYAASDYVSKANMASRKVLYRGPAFPNAGQISYPIVIMSPEKGS